MAPTRALCALLLLALAVAAQAGTYFECDCSPTDRGYPQSAYIELRKYVDEVNELEADFRSKKASAADINSMRTTESVKRWKSCIDNFSQEECINADTALRLGDCYPKCRSFCKFDEPTWINMNHGLRLPACDRSVALNAISPEIIAGLAERPTQFRPPAIRPSPRPPIPVSGADAAAESGAKPTEDQTAAAAAAAEAKANADAVSTKEALGQNNESKVKALPIPADKPVSQTSTGGTSTETPATVVIPGLVQPTLEPSPGALLPVAINEGCVAVEHLHGYVLQHRQHLRRAVLCSRGFCATPNHAIIVAGKWTSMRTLCAREWSCIRAVKMVNNLKLAANSRAKVSDLVTVTPYDARFPVWATWAAQMAEDAVGLVSTSVVAGVAVVTGMLLSARLQS